jgi:5,10-methylenetetrahydromethanopterin reductase
MSDEGVEFWILNPGAAAPQSALAWARRLESDGWDGVSMGDTQCLQPDPYALLAAIAMVTDRVLLETTVTNPVTRHPAAVAGAIATIDVLSTGRSVLGLGRGDSALGYLGLKPPTLNRFSRDIDAIQQYLAKENVQHDLIAEWGGGSRGLSPREESTPPLSELRWLDSDHKVPLDVHASGARVIELARDRNSGRRHQARSQDRLR